MEKWMLQTLDCMIILPEFTITEVTDYMTDCNGFYLRLKTDY